MPFVTTATDKDAEALSFSYEAREDAIVKAIELVEGRAESVAVTDVYSGEILAGEDLLAAIQDLAKGGPGA